jgi:putative ABC transport system permease protein
VITVVILGVVAVALAPLFTARRMRRMNLPGTLRLVE